MEAADILANLRAAIVVLDSVGNVIEATGGVDGGFLGYEMDELVEMNALDFVAPDDIEDMIFVFADGGLDVMRRFHPPFPLRIVARDGHVETVDALPAKVFESGQKRWVVSLTPRAQQSLTYHALDRYLTGAGAVDVAVHVAQRITEVTPEGVRIDGFVLHGFEDGVATRVTAGDPSSILLPMLEFAAPAPHAPWNQTGSDEQVLDPAVFPPGVAAALAAVGHCTASLRLAGTGADTRLGLLLFANHDHSLSGNLRLVVNQTFEIVEMALARTEALEVLRDAAERDPLTGLANRNRFADALDADVDEPMAALYIDLDHFKDVNDTFGHAVGDAVLVEVGRRITAACRPGDEIARLGGDEFAVVLRGVDADAAHRIGQRVVERIAEPLPAGTGPARVTASVGLAADARAMRDLVEAADLAMLEGKRAGRGTLVTAGVSPRRAR